MINPKDILEEDNYSILDGLINNAPLTVAYSFDQFESEINQGRKLNPRHALFDFCCSIESLIKFLVSIALIENVSNNKGRLPDSLANDLREKLQSPTFNAWRDVLARLVNVDQYKSVLLPEIKGIQAKLDNFIKASSKNSPDTNLTKIRNAIAHGSALSGSRANEYLVFWLNELKILLPSLACLQSIELWVGTKDQARKMNGYSLDGVEGNPPSDVLHLLSDNKATILFRNVVNQPVALKMHPINQWSNLSDGSADYLQFYARFGNFGPLYDLFSNDDGLPLQVEGAPENLEAIKTMLNFKDKQDKEESAKYEVESQEADVESAAKKKGAFVGRDEALNALIDAVSNKQSGIIWLSGPAGIGKSALMGQLYLKQLEASETDIDKQKKLLFFRFKADSYNCNRSRFMMWLHERIKQQGNNINTPQDPDEILKVLPQLFQVHDKQCLIMLDGLDELIRREPRFLSLDLERIIKAANDKALFVIASRDEFGIKEKMQSLKAQILFPNGLVGMSAIELRQMLEALGNHNAMRKIIKFDQDNSANNELKNKVIDIIIERSKGLPLYLNLLRTDIADGKIPLTSFADLEKTLPKSVEDFFFTVCERQGFSDSYTIPPKIAFILAYIGEPLSTDQIADILSQLVGVEVNKSAVSQLIQRLTGILIPSFTHDGFQEGFRLLHTDFQDYIKKVDHLKLTRSDFFKSLRSDNLKIFKEPKGEGAKPLYRNGIRILLEIAEGSDEEEKQKIINEAEALACNTDYQVARLKCLAENGGDAGFVNDWHLLRDYGAGWVGEGLKWSCFWLNEGYKFAIDHGQSGFEQFAFYLSQYDVSKAEFKHLSEVGSESLCAITQFKSASSLLTIFHEGRVNGAMLHLDKILSWTDLGLYIWDKNRFTLFKFVDLKQQNRIRKIIVLRSNKIAFLLEDGSVNLMTEDFTLSSVIHELGYTENFIELQNGNLLCVHDDVVLSTYSFYENKSIKLELKDYKPKLRLDHILELKNGRILTVVDFYSLVIYSIDYSAIFELGEHTYPIDGVIQLLDGRVLSWAIDVMILWTLGKEVKSEIVPFAGVEDIEYLFELKDGRLLIVTNKNKTSGFDSDEFSIWIYSLENHDKTLLGSHEERICGAVEANDNKVISWGYDNCIKVWSLMKGQINKEPLKLSGHSDRIKGVIPLNENQFLSWSYDRTIKIWHNFNHSRISNNYHHLRQIGGAIQLNDGHLAAWSKDGVISLYLPNGEFCRALSGHTAGYIYGLIELSDGKLLSWSGENFQLILWDIAKDCRIELIAHSSIVYGAVELSNQDILSWSNNEIIRWNLHNQSLKSVTHIERIDGDLIFAIKLRNNMQKDYLLTLGRANIYDRFSQFCILEPDGFKSHKLETEFKSVLGSLELSSGLILSWTEYGLFIWSISGLSETIVLDRGAYVGAIELKSGGCLAWKYDGYLHLWSSFSTPYFSIRISENHILGAFEFKNYLLTWDALNFLALFTLNEGVIQFRKSWFVSKVHNCYFDEHLNQLKIICSDESSNQLVIYQMDID